MGDVFIKLIMTVGETWVRHFEPESKRQSLVWKHTSYPTRKKNNLGDPRITGIWKVHFLITSQLKAKLEHVKSNNMLA